MIHINNFIIQSTYITTITSLIRPAETAGTAGPTETHGRISLPPLIGPCSAVPGELPDWFFGVITYYLLRY